MWVTASCLHIDIRVLTPTILHNPHHLSTDALLYSHRGNSPIPSLYPTLPHKAKQATYQKKQLSRFEYALQKWHPSGPRPCHQLAPVISPWTGQPYRVANYSLVLGFSLRLPLYLFIPVNTVSDRDERHRLRVYCETTRPSSRLSSSDRSQPICSMPAWQTVIRYWTQKRSKLFVKWQENQRFTDRMISTLA